MLGLGFLPLQASWRATEVINRMAKYPDFFVNVMMAEELELQVPDEDENPWIDGGVTFLSFVFFGTIPLLGYLCFYAAGYTPQALFIIACVITALALFGLYNSFSSRKWIFFSARMSFY